MAIKNKYNLKSQVKVHQGGVVFYVSRKEAEHLIAFGTHKRKSSGELV